MPNSYFHYNIKSCVSCKKDYLPTSGKQERCLICGKSQERKKQIWKEYAEKNRDLIKEKAREWYYKDIDHAREVKRRYAQSEKGKLKQKEYRLKNRDYLLKIADKYQRTYKTNAIRMQAKRLMTRDGRERVCVDCGSTKDINIHHVDGIKENNVIENLVYVCRKCHGNRHILLNKGKSLRPPL